MLQKATELLGTTVMAADGDVGEIDDLYFDDQRWGLRYLVVKTGSWFDQRKVLVSPYALRSDSSRTQLKLDLTREQVRNAPEIDTDQPVSRRQEIAHARHFQYPFYWTGPNLWGMGGEPVMVNAVPYGLASRERLDHRADQLEDEAASARAEQEAIDECHVRSCREVCRYEASALDNRAGKIDDLLIDDQDWHVESLVIDTTRWLPGGKVAVTTSHVRQIDWHTRSVALDLDRNAVKHSGVVH